MCKRDQAATFSVIVFMTNPIVVLGALVDIPHRAGAFSRRNLLSATSSIFRSPLSPDRLACSVWPRVLSLSAANGDSTGLVVLTVSSARGESRRTSPFSPSHGRLSAAPSYERSRHHRLNTVLIRSASMRHGSQSKPLVTLRQTVQHRHQLRNVYCSRRLRCCQEPSWTGSDSI